MDILQKIPEILVQFLMVLLFSLLIGLEQRKLQAEKHYKSILFGTDRTFTFIGILGFILYILDTKNLILFSIGAIITGVFLAVYYYQKIRLYRSFGFTNMIVALLTYSLAPIVVTQPRWFSILVVVSILILVEIKESLQEFSMRIDNNEFLILAKFLIIAGVILPILPVTPIVSFLSITPYQIWLSVVVVSSISYLSYLLQKYVFKKSGILLSGILGGLYSSTATTIILARKSKSSQSGSDKYGSSIILATCMMYCRIIIIMFIFNFALGSVMLPYFLILILSSGITGLIIYIIKRSKENENEIIEQDKNPLELKIASLFAALFIFFSFVTYYTFQYYGNSGIHILSYIVGFTDIDPYLLNLFQGKTDIPQLIIQKSTLQAIISNNILKILYTVFLGEKRTVKPAVIGIGLITLINLAIVIIL